MDACEVDPPSGFLSFQVNTTTAQRSHAQCEPSGDTPALAFDPQREDLCQGPVACANEDHRCVVDEVGAKRCVWVEAADVANCPGDYPDKTIGLITADAVCSSSELAPCTPKIVIAPNCMLDNQTVTETLDVGVCKPWPGDGAVWALKPGTVEPCIDDAPVTAPVIRPITLCCAAPMP